MPTTNRQLNTPARGDNVGTWDVPVNNNFTYIDQLFGAVTVVAVSSSNVTLSTPQCQNAIIRLTGTLSANIQIIFPTVAAIYTVENLTSGNYYVTCGMASGAIVGVPQGIPTQIFTDGTDTKYWNTPLPGTFMDYAGSALPGWMSASTTTPWLICDGSAVSRTTYATLYNILGTTWGAGNGTTTFNLPDLRNKVRVPLKSSSPLITSAVSGIDGTTVGASSTAESVTLTTSQIPAHTHTAIVTDPGHLHTISSLAPTQQSVGGGASTYSTSGGGTTSTNTSVTNISVSNSSTGGSGAHTSVQPTAVHGITLIKT
jgi:microcystin-dependent protein